MIDSREPIYPEGPSNHLARRFQDNAAIFSTISGEDVSNTLALYPRIALSATADSAGNPHFFVGSCLSREGNNFTPVLEIDFAGAVVKVLGQTLIVP